jgi:hypothetical protein
MDDEKIRVISYSGHRREEIPRVFFLGNTKVDIVEVLDMWIEEGFGDRVRLRFFKVRGDDGFIHKIYRDERTNEWHRRLR